MEDLMQVNRSKRKLAAVSAGLAVLVSGLVGSTGAAVSSGSAAGLDECVTAPVGARQMGGGDGSDPNSVSKAEARVMEARLRAGIRGLEADAARSARGRAPRGGHGHLPKRVRVNTYVHVITAADGTGDVTNAQIRAQLKVLNRGFGGRTARDAARTPFTFRLKAIDRTADDDWYDWANPDVDPADDLEAKTALHRGGWADLNIYIAGLGDGLLGYATFPGGDAELALDGVVLLNESLPGGAAAPYNEGDTGTHEVGHWLYLFHTFENGCEYPGDEVRDTPYQDDGLNIFECDESLDTCAQRGSDPVHNFMSYGDDPCLDVFSRGQSKRMAQAWTVFRKGR
jgi:hypothetical protein